MRVIIVGLGVQGRKRNIAAGPDVVATVDPEVATASHRAVADVAVDAYDAALVCTPDAPKAGLLTYLLERGKHVLVEKPLLARRGEDLRQLAVIAARNGAVCYTAYNHRFEPHLVSAKRLLDEGAIGAVYQARFFYGNGTARDVRNSEWRDHGLGAIPDLGSHLLDLVAFLFGRVASEPRLWAHERFENKACDYFMIGFTGARPMLTLEGSLVSWRNRFMLDITGETGSIHVDGLCKWGPASLTLRKRRLPSGPPDEQRWILRQDDPTWALEYQYFNNLCASGCRSDLANDIAITEALRQVAEQLGVEMLP